MRAQGFSRWFTVWPSTHVNAGKTVEVMPVSEHEALKEAAQAVVDALNFYDSTLTTAYRNEQRPHVLEAARTLRAVLASADSEADR